jgi:hypothetical protein
MATGCLQHENMVQVTIAEGHMYNSDGTVSRRFAAQPELVPLSLVLREHPSGKWQEAHPVRGALSLKPGEQALFLGLSHLGAMATVLSTSGAGVDQFGQAMTATGVTQPSGTLHLQMANVHGRECTAHACLALVDAAAH